MSLPVEILERIADHCEVNTAARLRVALGRDYGAPLPTKGIWLRWIVKRDAADLLRPYGYRDDIEHVWSYAADDGALECIKWLDAHSTKDWAYGAPPVKTDYVEEGLLAGFVPMHSSGCTTSIMDKAAANGHLAIVQYLHTHRTEGCTTMAMDMAAAGGWLETLKWLHEHRTEGCTPRAKNWAESFGRKAVLEWLNANFKTMPELGEHELDMRLFVRRRQQTPSP